ncbi:MAG: hypothetical protein AB7N61_16535 [Acidimicrobiia bacterium]
MGTFLWVLGAIVIGVVVFKIGMGMLRSFGTPLPPPPPAGEMRKVNIRFRCSICGTEVKMTTAAEELPEPPRHCQEDMDLVAPIE